MTESSDWKDRRRTFRWATWLGWQLESNWTEPWLFIIYVLLKPVSSSLLLVCMYYAAREVPQSKVPVAFLPYMYVGNACFMLVGAVMFGMSSAVISDRENYRMLKYIYISPARLQTYLVGRALSGALQALLGALINIGVGILAFKEIREALAIEHIQWFWLVFDLLMGTLLLVALGLILSAAMLNMSRQGMYLSEGIAGVMYLMCGVIFPTTILPTLFQKISLVLPPTYWLESMRRDLLGTSTGTLTSPIANLNHLELSAILVVNTVVFFIIGVRYFHWSEQKAYRNGRIEETSGA